jgi:mRNA-degrading endonuclease RelE of RelBE toxin-antitoxin system
MRVHLAPNAIADYRSLPPKIQKAADKQFALLQENLRHPSLRAKKYDERLDEWQARVSRGYRFYFQIEGDTYVIVGITRHPK